MNTMNRLALFAASLALAVVFAGLPQAAHAQDSSDETYRRDMPDLFDYSDRWLDEADDYLVAISAKPELACSDDYASFLLRGNSLVADYIGTGWLAPSGLAGSHVASGEGLAEALAGTRLVATACDGSQLEAGKAQFAQGRHDFGMNSLAIRHHLKPIFLGAELPSLPIIGPATH